MPLSFVALICLDLARAPVEEEAHAFGQEAASPLRLLTVELRCKTPSGFWLAVHDVDGVGRCTADDTLLLHERAWERFVVDAATGWFALRALATGRWLAIDGAVATTNHERDPTLHWRVRRGRRRALENSKESWGASMTLWRRGEPGALV